MFRRNSRSKIKAIILWAALLAYPCAVVGQHGGGGGHVGGSAAAGGGLSAGNHASGVDAKDDLRDFHQILAVQASSEQRTAYAEMMRNTAVAGSQLQGFVEQLDKDHTATAVAGRDKTLEDAVESARILNKKFLEGFSEAQKSGLKEITKRLIKVDSELSQQAKVLDQEVEVNASFAQMTASVQSLGLALTNFQREQIDLGDEMSIPPSNDSRETRFTLPTTKNPVNFANQPLVFTTSGVVSKSAAEGGQNTFAVNLMADVSDLQLAIADVLRSQVNKSERCGDRIAVQTAVLTPQGSAGVVVVQLHFERWRCSTTISRENMSEMMEGNGTIEVKLTPAVADEGTLQLGAQIERVDAAGLVGDLLRSGALGAELRDKVAASILAIIQLGADFKSALPAGARSYTVLHRAQFQGTSKLLLVLEGDIRVSDEQVAALTSELRGHESPEQAVPGPLLPRQSATQEPVSR